MATHETIAGLFQAAADNTLGKTDLQILRVADDEFRRAAVTAGSAVFKESEILTRQTIAQKQLDEFAKQGITAITYSDGRKMPVTSYAEMVGRTMSGHAAIQANINHYSQHGFDLLLVSAHFGACQLCTPWEGRVLSQSGQDLKYPSLQGAIAAGLFHPNCNHNVAPWREGLPIPEVRLDPEQQKLIDEHGYDKAQQITYQAQQRQREIERKIREWKLREATAVDSIAKAKAAEKVKAWQAAQRSHIANNTFLRRDYVREGVKGISGAPQAVAKAGYVPAKTLDEAVKYALQYIDNFEMVGVGLNQLNEINRSFYVTRANYDFKTGKLAYLPRKHANHTPAAHQSQRFTGDSKALYFKKTMLSSPNKAHRSEMTAWAQVQPNNISRLRAQISDPANANIKSYLEDKLRKAEVASRWSMSGSAKEGDYLFAVASHENGHAIMSKYGLTEKWNTSLVANQVDVLDLYRVSEYAATNNSELFAEVTSAVAQGRSSDVPKNILAAYRETIGSIGGN